MDYHHLYNTNCSRYNHLSTTFPPNYGIPQGFSRQAGFEGHVYDTRPVVRQTVAYDYSPYSHMWNIQTIQQDKSISDTATYPETVSLRLTSGGATQIKSTLSEACCYEKDDNNETDIEDRSNTTVDTFAMDVQYSNETVSACDPRKSVVR